MNYKKYLRSPRWRLLAWLRKWLHPFCAVCGREYHLELHHNTYQRVARERWSDLTVLCHDCHSLFHRHYVYNQRGWFDRKR